MKHIFTFLLIVVSARLYGQTLVIGDSTNKHVQKLNATFIDTAVSFDFDCDGQQDINFLAYNSKVSAGGTSYGRLSFYMSQNVEVLNSGIGNVTTFLSQQTVDVSTPNLWTKNLDYIFGFSPMGNYGQIISKKFIVFRKLNAGSTPYFFMEISNDNVKLTIHQVISDCSNSLLSAANPFEPAAKNNVLFFPNPVGNKLTVKNDNGAKYDVVVYDLQGKEKKVFRQETSEILDVSELPAGTYMLKYSSGKTVKGDLLWKK